MYEKVYMHYAVIEVDIKWFGQLCFYEVPGPFCPKISTTSITAMGCLQCLPLSVV
jgi:hypothetical protein